MKGYYYRVKTGETIFSISSEKNISPFDLILDNNLKKEVSAGDLLYIMERKAHYRCKIGDNLESVAKNLGVTKEELSNKLGLPYVFYGLIVSVPIID